MVFSLVVPITARCHSEQHFDTKTSREIKVKDTDGGAVRSNQSLCDTNRTNNSETSQPLSTLSMHANRNYSDKNLTTDEDYFSSITSTGTFLPIDAEMNKDSLSSKLA